MSVGMVIFHVVFISACVGASWYMGYKAGRVDEKDIVQWAKNKKNKEKISLDN